MIKYTVPLLLAFYASFAIADMTSANQELNSGNFAKAAEEFRRLAEQGDAKAQSHMGYMYHVGEGVPQDYAEAVKWYRKAAVQGNRDAQYNLAVAYSFGEGIKQDYKEAAIWYRRAAEQGHVISQYSLGISYEFGEGVRQDQKQAAVWFQNAADQGYERAQVLLGSMYHTGDGVPKDFAKAVYWYRKAAERDNSAAQYNLGTMYRAGKGVEQDYNQAIRWFRMAADQGYASAQNELASMERAIAGAKKNVQRPAADATIKEQPSTTNQTEQSIKILSELAADKKDKEKSQSTDSNKGSSISNILAQPSKVQTSDEVVEITIATSEHEPSVQEEISESSVAAKTETTTIVTAEDTEIAEPSAEDLETATDEPITEQETAESSDVAASEDEKEEGGGLAAFFGNLFSSDGFVDETTVADSEEDASPVKQTTVEIKPKKQDIGSSQSTDTHKRSSTSNIWEQPGKVQTPDEVVETITPTSEPELSPQKEDTPDATVATNIQTETKSDEALVVLKKENLLTIDTSSEDRIQSADTFEEKTKTDEPIAEQQPVTSPDRSTSDEKEEKDGFAAFFGSLFGSDEDDDVMTATDNEENKNEESAISYAAGDAPAEQQLTTIQENTIAMVDPGKQEPALDETAENTLESMTSEKIVTTDSAAKNKYQTVDELKPLAVEGDSDAQYKLGVLYYSGKGVKQDYSHAFIWYRRAALQGDIEAQYSLGNMYLMGEGISQNDNEAMSWYALAAEQGHEAAQHNLENLQRVTNNQSESNQMVSSESQDYESTANDTGETEESDGGIFGFFGGMFGSDDVGDESSETLEIAEAEVDSASDEPVEEPTVDSAKKDFELGTAYVYGEGVPQNHATAVKYFQKAAEQNYAPAQYKLGVAYAYGEGVEKDIQAATEWYTKSAKQGYTIAQRSLASLYMRGEDNEPNKPLALAWFSILADKGNVMDVHRYDALKSKLSESEIEEAELLKQQLSTSITTASNII